MKIRTALTLKYTCITATIFLLCMVLIYLVSEHTRDQTFFRNLKSEGITKANLFLAGQVDAKTMQSVYLNNRKFINEVEVAVYTTDFHMLYHDAIHNDIVKETEGMIKEIIQKKEIEFHIGKYQGIGMVFQYKGKDYIVTAAAYDGYGYDNLVGLQETLICLFIIGLSLLFIAGYVLAKLSLKPIRNIVNEAETITASHIDRRIPVKNEKDELGELTIAFNELLKRLEISFNSQKQFVSNVSHELRTSSGCPNSRNRCFAAERANQRAVPARHAEHAAGRQANDPTDRRFAEPGKGGLRQGRNQHASGSPG